MQKGDFIMEKYTYFRPMPKTLEELKSLYRQLAFQHHPDRGGDVSDMQAVNNEYDELFTKLKDIHKNKDGTVFTSEKYNPETPNQFKDLIEELMKMNKITIEIIGCFVWVTGNTKPYNEKLKNLNFEWHRNKSAWFLKPETYRRKNRREYDLDEIRDMYGSSGQFNSADTEIHRLGKMKAKKYN